MEVRATQRLGPGQIFNQPQMSRGKPGVQMRILKLVCDPAKQGSLRSERRGLEVSQQNRKTKRESRKGSSTQSSDSLSR